MKTIRANHDGSSNYQMTRRAFVLAGLGLMAATPALADEAFTAEPVDALENLTCGGSKP